VIRVGVAVPAAGLGRRMGGIRKPWLELHGRPLLSLALGALLDHPSVTAVRVALAPDEVLDPPPWLTGLGPRVQVVEGGETRARSVRRAVRALPDVDVILVHDAARPLLSAEVVDRCLAALEDPDGPDGVVAGWPATDTLKAVDDEGWVVETPDRRRVWHAQTPQAFRSGVFRDACERLQEVEPVTDDASLVEALGGRVRMVEGDPRNIKVTRPDDVPVAERFLEMLRAEGRGGGGGGAGGKGS
jgi:2-C-methyl-D-erythritol 4-phosphate cytidylyltransferase